MHEFMKKGLIILLIILFIVLIGYSFLGMARREGFWGKAVEEPENSNNYNVSVIVTNNIYSIVVKDSNDVLVAKFYTNPNELATLSNIGTVTFVGESASPLWNSAKATILIQPEKGQYIIKFTLVDNTTMIFIGSYDTSTNGSTTPTNPTTPTPTNDITSSDVISALQKWGPPLIQFANSINPPTNQNSMNQPSSNYENYNHYNGSSYPTIFYGPNGGTAKIMKTGNSTTIVLTDSNGKTIIYYSNNNSSNSDITQTTYLGPNGGSATVTSGTNGQYIVKVVRPDGTTTIYYPTNSNQPNNDNPNQNPNQNPTPQNWQNWADWFNSSNQNNSQNSQNEYSNYLPQGIPSSQIPPGNEDLYILKSEVVPPVCPACPTANCPASNKKCPPCPACARCPEPSFECKKVPNYDSINNDMLPQPVLPGYSTFGM